MAKMQGHHRAWLRCLRGRQPCRGGRNHRHRTKRPAKGWWRFKKAIIAAGGRAVRLPFMPDDPRVVDSTGALALKGCPNACSSWAAASSAWKWARCTARWARAWTWWNDGRPDAGRRPRPGQDLAEDERQALRQHHVQDQDRGGQATPEGIEVTLPSRGGQHCPAPQVYDLVLQAVGRTPTARRSPPTRAGVASRTAASSTSTSRCAPTCRTSSPLATSSASHAGAQGGARSACGRRSDCR